MLAVVGTIPIEDFPLVTGTVTLVDDSILIDGKRTEVNRGTPALLAAACMTSEALGEPAPVAYLVGDIGRGDGSRRLYEYLNEHIAETDYTAITFHYVQPDVGWHDRILSTIKGLPHRPILIADAGYMYAAKMSGQSAAYDLFTPDIGELAFLADESAPHPFYTRGFILHDVNHVPDLIARAYAHTNAARYMLVKGVRDHLADSQGILATIDTPSEEALEAIGGTGDILTGIVAAVIASGRDIGKAAVIAARVNRWAGHYAHPDPGTQVMDIIRHIPRSLEEILHEEQNHLETESKRVTGESHP
jgi:hypothetical protein